MKDNIRVSMGTLRVLGMEILESSTDPTTAYLQTYEPGKCRANCAFCSQARGSESSDSNIARGLYVPRDTKKVYGRLSKAREHGLLGRACIQTMNYKTMYEDLRHLVTSLRERSDIPISVSIYPQTRDQYVELKELGADRIVIPLDGATEEIFEGIKGKGVNGPYSWKDHMTALEEAIEVMGEGNVGTHLIIGLGETEREAVSLIQELHDKGVYTALFAYTPSRVPRLPREPPRIGHYRRIQLARHLINNGISRERRMDYINEKIVGYGMKREEKEDLEKIILSGEPFMTSGCPDCNRPFSTERPGGTIYNYPYKPDLKDAQLITCQLLEDYNVF